MDINEILASIQLAPIGGSVVYHTGCIALDRGDSRRGTRPHFKTKEEMETDILAAEVFKLYLNGDITLTQRRKGPIADGICEYIATKLDPLDKAQRGLRNYQLYVQAVEYKSHFTKKGAYL